LKQKKAANSTLPHLRNGNALAPRRGRYVKVYYPASTAPANCRRSHYTLWIHDGVYPVARHHRPSSTRWTRVYRGSTADTTCTAKFCEKRDCALLGRLHVLNEKIDCRRRLGTWFDPPTAEKTS